MARDHQRSPDAKRPLQRVLNVNMSANVRAKRRNDESGTILIVTLLVLLVVSSIGVGVVIVAGSEGELSGNMKAGEQALYYRTPVSRRLSPRST